VARKLEEPAVLTRWIDKKAYIKAGNKVPKAKYLDIILYSREQNIKQY
jgi:hypothetical protein